MIISRQAQLHSTNADVLQNPQVMALLSDKELDVADAVKKAEVSLSQAQQ